MVVVGVVVVLVVVGGGGGGGGVVVVVVSILQPRLQLRAKHRFSSVQSFDRLGRLGGT